MIHIVMPETLADELLEQIGFLIGAFRRAKARDGGAAVGLLELGQTTGRKIQCLLPAGFTEDIAPISWINVEPLGWRILSADEGFGQAVVVLDIVKSKPTFDAEAPLICGAIDPFDIFNAIPFDLEADLTAHPAEGADAFDFMIKIFAVADLVFIGDGGRQECSCRAGLHAFTAGHTAAFTHGVCHIKGWIGIMTPARHADNVIDLNLAASAHAEAALNTGIEIDGHGDMAVIQ